MAAQVGHLPQLKLPAGPSPVTAEQRHWKSFKNNLLVPSPTNYAVTHISYNPPPPPALGPVPPGNDVFAVTTGTRVQIYSARTCKLVKTVTRFGDVARSGVVRADGRIVAAGDDQGLVQVFDHSSRAILRTWTDHKPQPVWAVRFSPTSSTSLLSAGDDKTVRLWDLPSEQPAATLRGHDDYVRSAAFVAPGGSGTGSGNGDNVFVSGSYDATVRVWDSRVAGSVMTFRHAAPVEDVLPMPSGTRILAAAGNTISVLDLVAARPVQVLANHQKTVTSLSLASGGRRVVSGGLDGHVKVFETTGWNVVYGHKYESPVLAVRVIGTSAADDDDASDRHLLVGMHSGLLSVKTRLSGAAADRARERRREMDALVAGGDGIDKLEKRRDKRKRRLENNRKLDLVGEGADVVIAGSGDAGRRTKVRPWERLLRQGRYAAALDLVLDAKAPDHSHLTVLNLLTALRHRGAVREALEGRDETTVQPAIRWVAGHIMDPRYTGVCVEAALHLLDLYSEHAAGSAELHESFKALMRRVRLEVERAEVACQLGGMVESVMMAAAG